MGGFLCALKSTEPTKSEAPQKASEAKEMKQIMYPGRRSEPLKKVQEKQDG
jgi:hypothetical protein